MTVVLGEMVVARVGPYQPGQGDHQCTLYKAWFAPHGPAAVTNLLGRLEVRLLSGERRPPGPDSVGRWRIGDESWRRLKEGWVEKGRLFYVRSTFREGTQFIA